MRFYFKFGLKNCFAFLHLRVQMHFSFFFFHNSSSLYTLQSLSQVEAKAAAATMQTSRFWGQVLAFSIAMTPAWWHSRCVHIAVIGT